MELQQSVSRVVSESLPVSQRAVKRRTHGQVMIIFALASLVLVGFVALSIDTGFMMAERRQVQSAADAAALAAAKSLFHNKTNEITAAARAYGAENAGVPQGNVVVNWPPISGAYAGDTQYVQVTITKDVQRFFVGALYSGDWEVTASAVAGVDAIPADIAMLALNGNSGGIRAVGNAHIYATGNQATIMSNYNYRLTGNVQVDATGYVNANNGFNTTGNIDIDGALGSSGNVPEVPDPLAGRLSEPPIPPCPTTDDPGINVTGNNTVTINPGTHVYHGQGISLTGNSTLHIASGDHTFWFCDGADFRMTGNQNITKGANTRVTMYFIGGGGLRLTGNSSWTLPSGQYYFINAGLEYTGNAVLRGDNVFFYFSGTGSMRATGNGSFAFSAPTTTIYPGYVPGILVYANANNTSTFRWVGNSGVSSQGAIYLPSATMEMTGNSGQVIIGQIIADNFDFVGNAQIGVHYYQYVDFSNPKIYLVE